METVRKVLMQLLDAELAKPETRELKAELAAVTAERDALRGAVNATPHDNRCRTRTFNTYPSEDRKPGQCNCWKAEVWLRDMAERESACKSIAVGGSITEAQTPAPAPEGWDTK
jgi:hypothetical protein